MDPHSIRSLLRCPVCKNDISNPSTLHCGHTICGSHRSCTLHADTSYESTRRVDVSLQKIIELADRFNVGVGESRVRTRNDDDDDDDEYAGRRPPKRARTENEDDEENDLLAHLRAESVRERTLPQNEPVLPSGTRPRNRSESFEKDLVTELTCEICLSLMYVPVTTPCQHTFCSRCLHRSLDHSEVCPICRQHLPGFAYFQNHPPNELMLRIILQTCPSAYEDRRTAIEAEEHNARLKTPIFVCHLSFPGMPILLHFFEPKYRLMLRRCLDSPWPSFGMIMSSSASSSSASSSNLNTSDQIEYGTMLEIRSVQTLPDGRSMVETWGVWRFRILERGLMDGYVNARIERIDDIPDEEENEESESPVAPAEVHRPSTLQRLTSRLSSVTSTADSPSNSAQSLDSTYNGIASSSSSSESSSVVFPTPPPPLPLSTRLLIEHCTSFLSQLHTSTTPWVVQRLSYTHGPPPPSDPSDPAFDAGTFSFYVGMVLPIDDWEKAKLLPVRSVRMRLKMCVWWIEGLRQHWWFERGCIVL
ncbi:MAG: PUA-like domain-containing protein [Lentinula lateritia]|uniref:PUA-like domain-containing protein n=1 Tax=Lentinula lateritia TaxID=40482 RepID=A0ABQ8VT09_9AGAR|nr:MAG: PUA-like domain-containing protein [Lentinula lateritia]KAJ4498747.1 PUA-like domain-containing protein [Lentinula lateritia]